MKYPIMSFYNEIRDHVSQNNIKYTKLYNDMIAKLDKICGTYHLMNFS